MKKLIMCVLVCLIGFPKANRVIANGSAAASTDAVVEKYISEVYAGIDFKGYNRLAYDVFDKAYHGYLNLLNAGKLNSGKQIITICDFSKPSTENRLWIIDLNEKKVLYNTYVAHGQGSGDDYATSFSNDENSHQSSLGFYVTGDTYMGDHRTSLRLYGMDYGFNDNAFERGIVMHGADYVSNTFINGNQRLGRSWGCPAVPMRLSQPIINTVKDGTCLFIYYPEKDYLQTGYWLNKKTDCTPEDNQFTGIGLLVPKTTVIKYITNGKVDSTKTITSF